MNAIDVQNGPTHHDHRGGDTLRRKPTERRFQRENRLTHVAMQPTTTLFARFVFYFDGFVGGCDDSLMSLHRAVLAHSATVAPFLTRSVTHIVASSLAASKLNRRMTSRRGSPPHLVRPDWITDSIAARKLLSTAPYRPANLAIVASTTTATLDLHPITRWFVAATTPPPLVVDPPPIQRNMPPPRRTLMPLDVNQDVRRRKRQRIEHALDQLTAANKQSAPTSHLRKAQD